MVIRASEKTKNFLCTYLAKFLSSSIDCSWHLWKVLVVRFLSQMVELLIFIPSFIHCLYFILFVRLFCLFIPMFHLVCVIISRDTSHPWPSLDCVCVRGIFVVLRSNWFFYICTFRTTVFLTENLPFAPYIVVSV